MSVYVGRETSRQLECCGKSINNASLVAVLGRQPSFVGHCGPRCGLGFYSTIAPFRCTSAAMRSSPFISRNSIAFTLSLLSSVFAQSIPGSSMFSGNGAPGAGPYQLVDDYEGSSSTFFNKFNYYSVSHLLARFERSSDLYSLTILHMVMYSKSTSPGIKRQS